MAFTDLRSFLAHLEAKGDLVRVRAEVDPVYELNEIAQRTVRERGPALLFENVKGSPFPLAINFLATFERITDAIGMEPEALGEKLLGFAKELNPPKPGKIWGTRDFWPRLIAFRPRRAFSAPCHDIVDHNPDLLSLPMLKTWPQDGGSFVTFPLVFTRHPVDGKSNVGIYRMQRFDRTTTGMHWQIQKGGGFHYHEAEKRGHALPVAVVLGADPALMLAGIFPLPEGFEEIAFAGILRAKATTLTPTKTLPIEVPANAEFVLEGEVPPYERRLEGPFGDHFGHYCDAADFPVFNVRTITRRHGAIYPAAVVGKPPQEDRYMGDGSQMIMGPLIKLIRPEVRDVWAYYESGFHNLLVVSMEARYVREPIRTAMGILGEGQLGLSKVVVMVDADVDARSFPAVLDALRDNFDPREDFMLISKAPLDTLDFTSFKMHLGSRMVLNATRGREQYSGGTPLRDLNENAVTGERHPPTGRLGFDPLRVHDAIDDFRWWNDCLLTVRVNRIEAGLGAAVRDALLQVPELKGVRMVAVVSPDVNLQDDVEHIWGIFTRFDPARDVNFPDVSMTGVQPNYAGTLGIDATWKPGYPDPVEMPDEIVRQVDRRWREFFPRG